MSVPSVSPPIPHGNCNNQQQQIKSIEDAQVTDIPQNMKHHLDEGDEGEEHDDRPYDPNLVCPTCKKQFRIGEIQEYKKHFRSCQSKKEQMDQQIKVCTQIQVAMCIYMTMPN